ncbi:hypothetical protein [Chitinophaga sp. LS1]|uniref:hypothetical protein n=1 Tax=Chitinophaga sp. LS1 TaxID=3051176 RepID=UPI002AAC381B|nr:hypothetical protein [Chitinophaga sp. LS1]WPV69298.1 hypothetical protein QQL36_11255 [Chitinophaga sp. LS1]
MKKISNKMIYSRIFISTYKYYSKFKNQSPRFSAAMVLTVSQFCTFMLVLIILQRALIWDVAKYVPNKYVVIPIGFIWVVAIYNYFSEERIHLLLENFNELPKGKRKFWAVMSLVFFLLPMILIGIVGWGPRPHF